eukprot:scaffold13497_cov42-Phaeocystis_antarctica.AAC.1
MSSTTDFKAVHFTLPTSHTHTATGARGTTRTCGRAVWRRAARPPLRSRKPRHRRLATRTPRPRGVSRCRLSTWRG